MSGVLAPQIAPRSIEELAKETPFKLRLLAKSLGGLNSVEQKMDWHATKTAEDRARFVLPLLEQWDLEQNPLPGDLKDDALLAETERRMSRK